MWDNAIIAYRPGSLRHWTAYMEKQFAGRNAVCCLLGRAGHGMATQGQGMAGQKRAEHGSGRAKPKGQGQSTTGLGQSSKHRHMFIPLLNTIICAETETLVHRYLKYPPELALLPSS